MEKTEILNQGLSSITAEDRPHSGSEEADNQAKLDEIGWAKSKDRYRMDGDKLIWHLDRVKDWIHRERVAPLHIDMGIINGCNLGCVFCYGVVQGRKGFLGRGGGMQMMPLEKVMSVFSDAKKAGVRSINIDGSGENTLNPALYPSIEHARKIDLDVSLATHGANLFNTKNIQSLLTSLQWLRINLSAATPESYEIVHQRKWFDRVMRNTEHLVKGKKVKGYRNGKNLETTIGFQMVLGDKNIDDIVPLAKLGRDMGIDYTVIKPTSDTPDGKLNVCFDKYLEIVDIFKEAQSYSNENYEVIVKWKKMGNMGNKVYNKCHGTRFIIAIEGDGAIFPCGHWFNIERERFLMGNVNETSLAEIFRGDQYWKVQDEIHKLDLRYCQSNCRQHGVNLTLDEIATESDPVSYVDSLEVPSEEPEHITFV